MRYLVFFAVALLVMSGLHYYVWARLVRDAGLAPPWKTALTTLIAVLFAVMMLGFFVFRLVPRSVASPISWIGFTWLGTLFFLFFAVLASDVVRLVATGTGIVAAGPSDPDRRLAISRIFGGAAAALGLGASAAGLASVLSPVSVARVRVAIDKMTKAASGYRIVQISDVHVGPTIGKTWLADVVARINALSPDLVAITGDLVDGSVAELREHVAPLADLRAKDGVFFVTGNHEYYSGADEWIAHLRTLGIKVLRNEHVSLAGFDLAGIDDVTAHLEGHGADLDRALRGRDPARACVLLAHQPKGIDLADRAGVDLQLSGHTHGGQMFPWGLFVRLQQPFVAGLHRLAKAQIYVSRGTGYWGPPMRVGSPAEITEIELVSAA